MNTYNQTSHSGDYREDNVSVSITVLGGTYGGGSEVLVIQEPIVFRDDITIKVGGGGTAFSIDTMHRMQCVMQKVTGSLSQGAHPGSYNGQDAYNDMLVVDDGSGERRKRTTESNDDASHGELLGQYARSASNFEGV